ncbi:cardiolipin synthase [Thalassotalea mangrovi]|uniref:Cardiolipin synthase n=1 Tax=Thalassotalea mangrovi TaxID=2572245 RepID=A0A4U1BCC7_9GAMM|nr:cardiolipin synthase [Thalassotalea mangrovi]TKB47844.1 cardiolipin synthase [Thalassotalea mangrovi]
MLIAGIFALFYLLGVASAFHAVIYVRTSQGAIAWALSLLSFPFIAVPAYWVFGRRKFEGYVLARKRVLEDDDQVPANLENSIKPYLLPAEQRRSKVHAAELMAQVPLVIGNKCELLIDGNPTFDSIFAGIQDARHYVLVQFYVVRDDELGTQLQDILIDTARRGVKVFFLYDELGSVALSNAYVEQLRDAGVIVHPFNTRKGLHNWFQVNFRNHRKVVVVDGQTAWIGGHNVGDEYLGKDERFGHWRDTHVKISGPAALAAQVSFMEDFRWATDSFPDVSWEVKQRYDEEQPVLIVPTGPADDLDTALLMFTHIINSAENRIWISTPYFVPDATVILALQLARLRNVDIRIIIPQVPDSLLTYFAAYSFFEELASSGVQFYRYQSGFIHEKVLLVDDSLAAIGTANFDNRSFRLNFEITALIGGQDFADDVEAMFEQDFSHCTLMQGDEYESKSIWFKFAVNASRLMSPVL